MAIAKSEVMANLLRTGDYNVRVTIGRTDNTSDLAFLELIRDSLGGGLIDSDDIYDFTVYVVNKNGTTTSLKFNGSGKTIINQISYYIPNSPGMRFDVSYGNKKRTWIIIR